MTTLWPFKKFSPEQLHTPVLSPPLKRCLLHLLAMHRAWPSCGSRQATNHCRSKDTPPDQTSTNQPYVTQIFTVLELMNISKQVLTDRLTDCTIHLL